MKDALLFYLLGSLIALVVLKVYASQEIDPVTGIKGTGGPDMELIFWTIFLSWVSAIMGITLIIFNHFDRKTKNEAKKG